jgi:hypothetical protein
MHGEEADAGGGANEHAPRRNRARHAGAMLIRLVLGRGGIEIGRNRAGEIGMGCIDAGIDHRQQYAVPGRKPVGGEEIELGRHVLIDVGRRLRILRQCIEIIGLGARHLPLAGHPADHRRDRAAAVEAPAMHGAAGEAEALGFKARHIVARRNRIEVRGRHARGNVENDLVRQVACLRVGRLVKAAAQARPRLARRSGRCADGLGTGIIRGTDRQGSGKDRPEERRRKASSDKGWQVGSAGRNAGQDEDPHAQVPPVNGCVGFIKLSHKCRAIVRHVRQPLIR